MRQNMWTIVPARFHQRTMDVEQRRLKDSPLHKSQPGTITPILPTFV